MVAITWIAAYIIGLVIGAFIPDIANALGVGFIPLHDSKNPENMSNHAFSFMLIFASISGLVVSGIIFWRSILDVPRG
jgi:hypothetical protein